MKSAAQIFTQPYHSPCGEMVLGDYAGKLCLCDWANGKHRRRNDQRIQHFFNARYVCGSTPLLQATAKELDAWFAGALVQFNLPLAMPAHHFSNVCGTRCLPLRMVRLPHIQMWRVQRVAPMACVQ